MAGKKNKRNDDSEEQTGEFTDEAYEQSEREIEIAEQGGNVPRNEKLLYHTDPSRVTAEQTIGEGYA